MSRMVKDYIEIGDHGSLDSMIARLTEIRDSLPTGTEAELRVRGDDIFGRHLCIGFMRSLTEDEAACDGRYASAENVELKRAA